MNSLRAKSRVSALGLRIKCGIGIMLGTLFFIAAPFVERSGQPQSAAAVLIERGLCVAAVGVALALMVLSLVPTKVVVGSDGVMLQWLGRRVFVAFRDLVDVRVDVKVANGAMFAAVELVRRGGRNVRFAVGDREGEAFKERLVTAWRHGASSAVLPLPERGSRPLRAWLAELRATALGAPRASAWPKEAMLRVAEDASLPPEQRIAASIAAKEAGADMKERLLAIARTTAEPRLRVALEAVANDDEDELEASLDALRRP